MGLAVYNLFLVLYRTGIIFVSPWNSKARLWVRGRKNILRKIRAAVRDRPPSEVIWMHCASLGEFEQGRPVLEEMRKIKPNVCIVLTFFSASGYEIRKNYEGADHIFYLPLDSYQNARSFIDIIKPNLVLWVKYEYWYYYLTQLKKRAIPVLLISGIFRKDQLFFKWHGHLYRDMLWCFSHFFVQTIESKKLLGTIGLSGNVTVSGDTRFDRVIDIAGQFKSIPGIDTFCGEREVIVAGSTWPDDEEELDHFANTHPEIKVIIAPHEIDAPHLQEIKKLFHHSIFYTEWEQLLKTGNMAPPGKTSEGSSLPNILIIDNIGMLARLYKYATIAYIGGGFGDDGVHNVLEAAAYGKPVVFGPVYEKFVEAVELLECGGAFSIDNALELEEVFHILLRSNHEYTKAGESAKSYVYLKRGAKEKIVNFIVENNC
ncbi:MAG: glycosyltransferase N-terminal domain-containing protein [Chitinophagaceae bacterium]